MIWLERMVRWSYGPVAAMIIGVCCFALYRVVTEDRVEPDYVVIHKAPDLSPQEAALFMDALRQQLINPNNEDAFVAEYAQWLRYPIHIEWWHEHKQLAESDSFGGEPKENWRSLKERFYFWAADTNTIAEDATTSLTLFFQPEPYDPLDARYAEGLNRFFPAGVGGIYAQCRGQSALMPPMRWMTLASNGLQAANLNLRWMGCAQVELQAGIAGLVKYNTRHWVKEPSQDVAIEWTNTDVPVALEDVTKSRLEQFLRESVSWYSAHQRETGQLPYQYNVINDTEDSHNTMIRQWISNQALAYLSARLPDDEEVERLYRNHMDYLLERHYQQYEEYGAFYYQGIAHAAASAIAMKSLTIVLERDDAYADYYQQLKHGLERQYRDDYLETIIAHRRPKQPKRDNNFAPGAMLLALQRGVERGWVEPIPVDQLRRWFDFYYDNWQQERSLYATPWQILGYRAMMQMDREQSAIYRDAIYELADALVACQNDGAENILLMGAFNRESCDTPSTRPGATAMRAEGLIVAYQLAKEAEETERTERYRQAVRMAHRMVLQGQLRDHHMFFVLNPDKARYGMRFDLFSPSLRIDDIAHALISVMAALDAGVYDAPTSLEKSPMND